MGLKGIVLLVIVQARIGTFEYPDAHQYHQNFHWAVPEPPKNFLRHKYKCTFFFYRFNQSLQSSTRTSSWIGLTLKVFWGTLEQIHGSFSDIGAHRDFQKPEFFMPDLLINELWIEGALDPRIYNTILRRIKPWDSTKLRKFRQFS